jgi:hypothetical protein
MTREEATGLIQRVQEIGALLNDITDYVQSLDVSEDVKQLARRGIADAMLGMNEYTLRAAIQSYPDLDPYRD